MRFGIAAVFAVLLLSSAFVFATTGKTVSPVLSTAKASYSDTLGFNVITYGTLSISTSKTLTSDFIQISSAYPDAFRFGTVKVSVVYVDTKTGLVYYLNSSGVYAFSYGGTFVYYGEGASAFIGVSSGADLVKLIIPENGGVKDESTANLLKDKVNFWLVYYQKKTKQFIDPYGAAQIHVSYIVRTSSTQATQSEVAAGFVTPRGSWLNALGANYIAINYAVPRARSSTTPSCPRLQNEEQYVSMIIGTQVTLKNGYKVNLTDIQSIPSGTTAQTRATFDVYDKNGSKIDITTLSQCAEYNKNYVQFKPVSIVYTSLGGNNYAYVSFASTTGVVVTSAEWKEQTVTAGTAALLNVTINNYGDAAAKNFYIFLDANWRGIGCSVSPGNTLQDFTASLASGGSKTMTFGVLCSTAGEKNFTVKSWNNNLTQVTLRVASVASTTPAANKTTSPIERFSITEAHYDAVNARTFATTNAASTCWMGFTQDARTFEMPCTSKACNQHQYTRQARQTIYVTCQAKDGNAIASKTVSIETPCSSTTASLSLTQKLATKGTCVDKLGAHSDYSVGDNGVVKVYCGPTSATADKQTCFATTTYNCKAYQGASGDQFTGSQDGRCITVKMTPEQLGCTDSDGGIKPYAAGVTKNAKTTANDACFGMALKEYYCDDYGNVVYQFITCNGPCSNGACIKPASAGSAQVTGRNAESIGNDIVKWIAGLFK